jgi:hypothetical protein
LTHADWDRIDPHGCAYWDEKWHAQGIEGSNLIPPSKRSNFIPRFCLQKWKHEFANQDYCKHNEVVYHVFIHFGFHQGLFFLCG